MLQDQLRHEGCWWLILPALGLGPHVLPAPQGRASSLPPQPHHPPPTVSTPLNFKDSLRKLTTREGKGLAQGHTAWQWHLLARLSSGLFLAHSCLLPAHFSLPLFPLS